MLVSSLLGFPTKDMASELEIKTPLVITENYIQEQIDYFSQLNGVDSKLISKVVECESQYNHNASGDGNRAYGIFQYHKASFERHAKLYGEELDYYSVYDQVKLGTWSIANGMGNEWTAYRAITNGGTYSFYSKLLQKHFVVRCSL